MLTITIYYSRCDLQ